MRARARARAEVWAAAVARIHVRRAPAWQPYFVPLFCPWCAVHLPGSLILRLFSAPGAPCTCPAILFCASSPPLVRRAPARQPYFVPLLRPWCAVHLPGNLILCLFSALGAPCTRLFVLLLRPSVAVRRLLACLAQSLGLQNERISLSTFSCISRLCFHLRLQQSHIKL